MSRRTPSAWTDRSTVKARRVAVSTVLAMAPCALMLAVVLHSGAGGRWALEESTR